MSSYWTAFPGLSPPHNPAAPLQAEFARLAEHCGWDDDTRKAQWKICARAEFEHYFAGAQSELAGWHAMCDLVGVEAPTSIKRCREVRLMFTALPMRTPRQTAVLTFCRCFAPKSL
jgi:hypothetical protein